MRRIPRLPLPAETSQELMAEQEKINTECDQPEFSADDRWKSLRQRKLLKQDVLSVLRRMAGERERCMYCSDSQGNDIDHFRPKTTYPRWMLVWNNLLLCCGNCGRHKGNRFPLLDDVPLIIDPSSDDPWQFIDFEPRTGNLTPRFSSDGNPNRKGLETLNILKLDGRREAVSKGYVRSFGRIRRVVEEFLSQPTSSENLIEQLQTADDHGVLGWIVTGNGASDPPFVTLRIQHPETWSGLIQFQTAAFLTGQ